jgi:Tfp pilus assembly protein FimT
MILKNNQGFSFVELLVIMGIITALIMISSVNLFPLKQKVSLSMTIQSLISDIKQQQAKSMNGESYQGVYFNTDQKNYILFKGSTYDTSNSTNFNIGLGDQIIVNSIDFANRQIIFTPGSGEIVGFLPSNNKIILKNTVSGEIRTVNFNKFAVITNVQ